MNVIFQISKEVSMVGSTFRLVVYVMKSKDNPIPYLDVCTSYTAISPNNIKIPIDLIALAAFCGKSQNISLSSAHVIFVLAKKMLMLIMIFISIIFPCILLVCGLDLDYTEATMSTRHA